MRLNHNTMAYTANNNLAAINRNLTKSMQRLSSGYKVNKSSDDPAAMAISQRMNAQLRGLERATHNSNDGISLIQTAEGALEEVHAILARMRELAVRAANETYAEEDKDAMQDEIKQLQEEIDRIAETTDFNGRKLLNGELNKKGYIKDPTGATIEMISIAEIGGDIPPDEYGIKVNANGTPASKQLTALAAGSTITAAQAGSLLINDFEIKLEEGMTAEEVNERIRDAAGKIGIDYNSVTGMLTTQEFGSEQYLRVESGNPQIEALFGLDGVTEYGTNADVEFSMANGERVGFEDTATIDTQGNRITVTDKNGFKMVYDIDPAGFTGEARITVLSAGPMVLQIGNNEGQTLNININKTTIDSLGIDKINIYTNEYATIAMGKLDAAIGMISEIRSSLGAFQNRLDHTVTNLGTASENLTGAVSRIQDTDMAEEITTYTEKNVLSQSALQMLIKSNARPEGLLQLFQR